MATPPFGLWPVIFFAFIPLINGVEREFSTHRLTYRNVFLKGHITGLFYSISLFYWMVNVSVWAIIPVSALFACMQGLFATGILFGLRSGFKGVFLSLWIACLWVSIEILGSGLFFQLPSYAIGYLVWKIPIFIQIADITGVFGVSFWIISMSMVFSRWWRKGGKIDPLWTTAALCMSVVLIAYGQYNISSRKKISNNHQPVRVALVHTAVASEEKKDPKLKKRLFTELQQMTQSSFESQKQPVDLYVWPETSVPLFLRSIKEKEVVEGLLQVASLTQSSIVMGARAFRKDGAGDYIGFNAAFIVPPNGYISQEYHKMVLAPLVEKRLMQKMFTDKTARQQFKHLAPGKKYGIMALNPESKLGLFICWEAFFPNFVRQLANEGAGFFVNISNDEMAFDDEISAYTIPLPHAVFRAVENRRFLVRCANWGTSMIISPHGDIVQATQVGSVGVLTGEVRPSFNQTFFTRHGFILAKGLLLFTFGWGLFVWWVRRYHQS